MKKAKLLLLPFLLFLFPGIYAQTGNSNKHHYDAANFSQAELMKIVSEANHSFNQAFISGDLVKSQSHFTDDAVLLPPNAEQLKGKDAWLPVLKEFLTYGIKQFTDETTRVFAAGDYIIEEGNFFMGDDKGNAMDKGKYLCAWRKENGVWRVFSNMWSSNLPAAK